MLYEILIYSDNELIATVSNKDREVSLLMALKLYDEYAKFFSTPKIAEVILKKR